jgi:hypothetical protein
METVFTLGDADEDINTKINLDELYEKKQQQNLHTISIYNRILSRIHTKIKIISKKHNSEQVCWYIVPEMIIGINKYDNVECIAYIIDKLKENGFQVLYTHPNMLFISWKHWVPSYVRQEIKKKTGYIIDGYGNPIENNNSSSASSSIYDKDSNELRLANSSSNKLNENKLVKDYKSIDSYKPSGNLIYNQELLKNIEDKYKK